MHDVVWGPSASQQKFAESLGAAAASGEGMAFVLFGLSGLVVINTLASQISVLAGYVQPHECFQTGVFWTASYHIEPCMHKTAVLSTAGELAVGIPM